MKNTLFLIAFAISFTACSDEPKPKPEPSRHRQAKGEALSPKVIYGQDNRAEYFQAPESWQKLADATAMLVRPNKIVPLGGGKFRFRNGTFGDDYNLCPEEPFRDQQNPGFCSGFLVGPNTVVTAGHCIRGDMDCTQTSFVFGFGKKSADDPLEQVSGRQIYNCIRVVKTQADPFGADFAIVKIDRQVTNVAPLKMRESGKVSAGDELVVIGHPVGLPTKIAADGIVRSENANYIVASLDTYGGNSGSAVFNARTGEVEGVLVRGETDFASKGSCQVSNVCSQDGCRGEDVTKIEKVRAALDN